MLQCHDGDSDHRRRPGPAPAPLAAAPAPRAARVLIVHGLGEHSGRYDAWRSALNAAGWAPSWLRPARPRPQPRPARRRDPGADSLCADLAAVIDAVPAPAAAAAGAAGPQHGRAGGGALRRRSAGARSRRAWRGRCRAGAVVAGARPGMNGFQKLLLAVLGRWRRTWPWQRPAAGLDLARPGGGAAYVADPLVHDRVTPRLVRFIVDGGAGARRWRRAGARATLLMWAGADRCVAPPAAPPSPPRRRRRAAGAGASSRCSTRSSTSPRGAGGRPARAWLQQRDLDGYPLLPPPQGARHERPRPPCPASRSRRPGRLCRPRLGRAHRAGADRLHRRPGQEPDVRRRLGRPTATSSAWCATPRSLGRGAARCRPEARGGAPGRPHAGDLLRGAGHQGGSAAPTPCCCTATSTSSPSSTAGATTSGPWTPKYENGLLYGRGGADDGYAVYAAITAIEALRRRACRTRAAWA
jgi:hypothetical protein